jgi:serine/threonine protein kinase
MRATKNILEEQFIIPIARELAKGLRAIHEAGIIHRDVKGTAPPVAYIFSLAEDIDI